MAKKFLVWKDINCRGVNPEWLFLTGEEFYEFIQKEENKDRHFIKLPSTDKETDEIIIESTEKQYKDWRKEYDRSLYTQERNKNVEVVSVNMFCDKDNADLYEKMKTDDESIEDVVEKSILIGKLREALKTLTEEERKIIEYYYFTEGATERSVAAQLGIHYMTLHSKKTKILEKLKNFFVQI